MAPYHRITSGSGNKESTVAVPISVWAREFLERPGSFGTLSSLAADGAPMSAVVWYGVRADAILVNSAVGRAWPGNLVRDPRFSFVVEDGYRWLGVRGRAEALSGQAAAQADIAALARRYHADEPARAERLISERFERQERISFLLHPSRLSEHPDD
jgi:PPOX class probable F420-dependent enzyme